MVSEGGLLPVPMRDIILAGIAIGAIFLSIYGRHKNHVIAQRIQDLLRPLVTSALGLVLNLVDVIFHNEFRLYAEGNSVIEGLLITLKLKRRHDPVNFVYTLINPDEDLIILDVPFEKQIQPYSVSIINKNYYPVYAKEQESNFLTAHPVESLGTEELKEKCIVCTDCQAAAKTLLTEELCHLISLLGDSFKSLIINDNSDFCNKRSAIRLVSALPDSTELINVNQLPKEELESTYTSDSLKNLPNNQRVLIISIRIMANLIQKVPKVSLSSQDKEKANRARKQRSMDIEKRDIDDKKGFFDRVAEGFKDASGYKGIRNVPGMTRGMKMRMR